MNDRRASLLWMLAFAALWALVERVASSSLHRFSPYQVVWTRYAFHIGLMLLLWGWRDAASLWRTRRPVYQFARSMLMVGMPASVIIGVQHGLDGHTLGEVFWLSPLLVMALAGWLLGERAPIGHWVAAGVACAGAALMSGVEVPPRLRLVVFPLAMALSFSLYVVMTRSLRSESTRANLFYTAAGVLLVLSPLQPMLWTAPSLHELLAMAAVGVLGFGTLYALDRMAACAPVSESAPLACLQLGFTLLLTRSLDPSDHLGLAGLVLMAGAALYVWFEAPARPAGVHGASHVR